MPGPVGQQAVDEVAVAGFGRHAPGGRVRVRQQPELLEIGQLVADRRRPPLECRAERLGADRHAVVEVDLDQPAQHVLLAFGKHLTQMIVGTGLTAS